ncbi:hypothetical protein [Bacillus cereus]|uniref:hypothetical protein n=1 Tax=Bacillus cereus TaxID=1396 RepID=UPI000BF72297|nr:hypothetical protein [Bacillus cereus]PFF14676.1 hypothetical protein CN343_06970 [Bacillus cereus]
MTVTYKDVVYTPIGGTEELVWCEYRARFHTLIEIRYQVRVYEATKEYAPNLVYRKGKSIVDSSWKKTPQKARQDVEDEVGELKRENIRWEESFSVTIPIISEDF